eukprot:2421686-Alexandrium_andersonii.AAC.1
MLDRRGAPPNDRLLKALVGGRGQRATEVRRRTGNRLRAEDAAAVALTPAIGAGRRGQGSLDLATAL